MYSYKTINPADNSMSSYEHFREQASNYQSAETDRVAEPWRAAIESSFTPYVQNRYKYGVCSVYGSHAESNITIVVRVKSQQFQPKNLWNGYWESQWTLTFNENGGNAVLIGVLKVQVGYYEDGNMRLVCSKDVNLTLPVTKEEEMAKEFTKLVSDTEDEYQKAISENYQTMSTTTFKGLRRKLPANCCKIDWNNLISYKISRELKSLHIDKCEGN